MTHNGNKMHDTVTVLSRLREYPDILKAAKVVGAWIWVAFDAKPSVHVRDFLKAEGFVWNHKRAVWQHCGGKPSHHAPYDPRGKYGEVRAEDYECSDLGYEDACARAVGL